MSVRAAGTPPRIESEGKKTNPTTATVMADTGALSNRTYEVRVVVGCSVAATFDLQRRNAANDNNVGDVVMLYAAAGQSAEYVFTYRVETSERLRILPEGNITGTAACAIQVEELM